MRRYTNGNLKSTVFRCDSGGKGFKNPPSVFNGRVIQSVDDFVPNLSYRVERNSRLGQCFLFCLMSANLIQIVDSLCPQ